MDLRTVNKLSTSSIKERWGPKLPKWVLIMKCINMFFGGVSSNNRTTDSKVMQVCHQLLTDQLILKLGIFGTSAYLLWKRGRGAWIFSIPPKRMKGSVFFLSGDFVLTNPL